ncbi:MAG: redoxin domain-containing protein [Armatimonadetes bacterium]|nr:redoxin domain-containing protein [Armatimonadota bacterium]
MAEFQSQFERLRRLETQVAALSSDSEEEAREMVDRNSLTYPMYFGLDAERTLAAIGGHVKLEKGFVQPSGFLLRPDRTIVQFTQSSGPIGRFDAVDAVSIIKWYQESS